MGKGKRIRTYKQDIAAAMAAGKDSTAIYTADNVDLIDPAALAQLKRANIQGTPDDTHSIQSFLRRKSNN